MTERQRDRFTDESGHVRDMTEETLGAQEQERQERQHREERRQQRGRRTDESTYSEESDNDLP
ncbi:hypothetical protein ACFOZ0_27960 [Streptomyces yaanensis]|uniref:Uncharacterized protein n=1 Tax=Streptomyces yaanensis TaxID=1142239 RepID=A0ABV7SKT6_9ACTN|nr:hypothetical protein [Streptomyces sp. CGMCC 4.7035]WNC00284.1 hypothetical protein Q2K21_20675 [Streptomyces sp. CGMCC 4.7035]